MKSDKQIKTEATKKEYSRVYDNMSLPPCDIIADCSDGIWIKKAWQGINNFGWSGWKKH